MAVGLPNWRIVGAFIGISGLISCVLLLHAVRARLQTTFATPDGSTSVPMTRPERSHSRASPFGRCEPIGMEGRTRTGDRRFILVPALRLVVFVDVNVAVNLASRVFSAYFAIQATLATLLAARNRNWPAVVGFVAVGLAMLTILVFGLPL